MWHLTVIPLLLCSFNLNTVVYTLGSAEISLQTDLDGGKIIKTKLLNYNDDNSLGQNFTKLIRIADVLDVFNIEQIGEIWSTVSNQLGHNCSYDMNTYFKGLQSGTLWAIKMDDASGHYTTGFFYGNNYWTGSMTLCMSIYDPDIVQNIHDSDIEEPLVESKNNVGFSFTQDYSAKSVRHVNPPFLPGFFVLKIAVNDSIVVPTARTVNIGVCLPSTCNEIDVIKIAKLSQRTMSSRNINIIDIRAPTSTHFNFWADRTFKILFVVSSLVIILLVSGTSYDILLKRRYKTKIDMKKLSKDLLATDSSSGIGCTTYDLTCSVPNKADMSVGIGIGHSGMNNNNSDENLAMESASQEGKEEKVSIYEELLLSFSIVTNFKAICDKTVGSDTIPSIHGLRAISMAWVILGHTCVIVFKYSDNMELRKVAEKQFFFQTITNGAFSVDTFFFIGGFLVSYIYFRTNAKGKLEKLSQGVNEITAGTYHFFGLIFYRYIRLTAPYLFVLGVVELIMKYFAHYSVFEPPTLDHVNCPQYWWRNALYINTLFPVDQMCMLWSWYLANDTQFYVISSIILIIGVRHFKVAASTMTVFILSAWMTTAYIAFTHKHMPNTDDPFALFDKIYDKPWTRLGPYLIGMSVGWILFKTNCKIRMSKMTLITGWGLSSLCMLSLIYGLYNTELNQIAAAAYSSLSHSAWALALAWIVIACSTGYGGYVNTILSATWMYPFSRVTYCAYLVHPIVIRFMALNSDSPMHLGAESMAVIFFGQVISSYVLSFIVSLAFEAPVVTMLRIMSPSRKKRI